MPLSFKNIKNNAHQFVLDYTDAVKENAESQSFLNDFFAIFGINRRRVASFEYVLKLNDNAGTKRIDLFWSGVLFSRNEIYRARFNQSLPTRFRLFQRAKR